jgi:uncharacterized oxidoreductase
MPNIDSERLKRICHDILIKFGANEEEASTVAKHLIGANLVGHDSHGIIQLLSYVDRIKKGHIVPGAKFEVVNETPTTAKINGNWGFGQVVQTRATKLAIEGQEEYDRGCHGCLSKPCWNAEHLHQDGGS